MKRLLILLILSLAIPANTHGSVVTFFAGGTLTRLSEHEYQADVWGYVDWFQISPAWPRLEPVYPWAANIETWDVHGEFNPLSASPSPWQGGEDWLHVGPYRSPFGGIGGFRFNFYQGQPTERLFVNLEANGTLWYDLGHDDWFVMDGFTGSATIYATLPQAIGSSTDLIATPEPATVLSLGLGLALLAATWRRRQSRANP